MKLLTGFTRALFDAANFGELEYIDRFIKGGADVNARASRDMVDKYIEEGFTPMIVAANAGHFKFMEALLPYGADIHFKARKAGDLEEQFTTALFQAAMQGQLDCLKFLVEQGADLNMLDYQGHNALMLACKTHRNQCHEVVNYLVDFGLDINAKSENGFTALMSAIYPGYAQIDFIKLLLDRGADPLVLNDNGKTAIDAANHFKNTEAAQFMLSYHEQKALQLHLSNSPKKDSEFSF